ncbi:hypothetical protein [Tropicibacter alexandrii]|uniref:hypothetical protein n=1 Tax=Tropicibacter alexandrii TaxID=2267683 RepID=UPI000EF517A1|nr:hypothetical protein [Tropicibacter alexandrii]
MKPTSKGVELAKDRFTNPDFALRWMDESYTRNSPASSLAYMAMGLVATASAALDNDAGGTPMQDRGIDQTLFVAEAILRDLIDEAEKLELRAARISPV